MWYWLQIWIKLKKLNKKRNGNHTNNCIWNCQQPNCSLVFLHITKSDGKLLPSCITKYSGISLWEVPYSCHFFWDILLTKVTSLNWISKDLATFQLFHWFYASLLQPEIHFGLSFVESHLKEDSFGIKFLLISQLF